MNSWTALAGALPLTLEIYFQVVPLSSRWPASRLRRAAPTLAVASACQPGSHLSVMDCCRCLAEKQCFHNSEWSLEDLLMGYGIPCGALHGRPKRENHSKRQGESEACDHARVSGRQPRTGDQ